MLEVGHFNPRQGLSLHEDKAGRAREVEKGSKLARIPQKVRSQDTLLFRDHVI